MLKDAQFAQLKTRRPALVVVDVQRDFAIPAVDAAVTRIAELIDAARQRGVPVVWVVLGSDPARPWRASNWLRLGDYEAPMSEAEPCVIGSPGAGLFKVSHNGGEHLITKRGYSGFLGTDLNATLHELGAGWLTICGLTTECCVQATATDAVQLDWPVLIPRDATAAHEPGLHEAALRQLALNAGVVVDAAEVIDLWRAS